MSTRFQKGQSGNPSGRPKGSKNKATLLGENILASESEAILLKCVDMAKRGDATAMRLLIPRLIPVRRDSYVEIPLPTLEGTTDALKAIAEVVDSVSKGELTPSEGRAISSMLETHRRTLEMEELEQRLEELEARQQ
jgi:hypothetical protein